jgi:hypothetical protein
MVTKEDKRKAMMMVFQEKKLSNLKRKPASVP